MNPDPNEIVRRLVEAWCERKQYGPLAIVLPAWLSNNGLTDGWMQLHDAIRHAYAMGTDLPAIERDSLKQAYVAIDVGVRNR